jgi:hypothetical protein
MRPEMPTDLARALATLALEVAGALEQFAAEIEGTAEGLDEPIPSTPTEPPPEEQPRPRSAVMTFHAIHINGDGGVLAKDEEGKIVECPGSHVVFLRKPWPEGCTIGRGWISSDGEGLYLSTPLCNDCKGTMLTKHAAWLAEQGLDAHGPCRTCNGTGEFTPPVPIGGKASSTAPPSLAEEVEEQVDALDAEDGEAPE